MELRELHGEKILLNGALLGFENLNEFVIYSIDENPLFAFLQSIQDKNIGFIVASPFSIFKHYSFEIADIDKERIELNSYEDVLVLGILTIGKSFDHSTMNLLAPIVINLKNMKGIQMVLPPKYEYSTKTPIKKINLFKGGDSPC